METTLAFAAVGSGIIIFVAQTPNSCRPNLRPCRPRPNVHLQKNVVAKTSIAQMSVDQVQYVEWQVTPCDLPSPQTRTQTPSPGCSAPTAGLLGKGQRK